MRQWVVILLIVAPWLLVVPTLARIGYVINTEGSALLPNPIGPELSVGYRADRQPVAVLAATATAPVSATSDVGPLGSYARATLVTQCYQAAGRSTGPNSRPGFTEVMLRDCLAYVAKIP